jgi:CheY-like chemotaxis protein
MTQTIVAIDDEPNNLVLLENYLEETGHKVCSFPSANAALEYLGNGGSVDVILLDRMMPEMDGLGFMKALRDLEKHSSVPVVMQTAAASNSEIAEGIAAGAYYYLTKPFGRDVLLAIVKRALADRAIHDGLQNAAAQMTLAARCMDRSRFSFRTLDEIRDISFFIASLFPCPDAAKLGITELMLNAVEHGNLGITYDEKTALHMNGKWREEIEARLASPDHRDKSARVSFERGAGEIILTIEDRGKGFNWADFSELDPQRASHSHGRGIAMALMVSFDKLDYVHPGNKVVCRKKL